MNITCPAPATYRFTHRIFLKLCFVVITTIGFSLTGFSATNFTFKTAYAWTPGEEYTQPWYFLTDGYHLGSNFTHQWSGSSSTGTIVADPDPSHVGDTALRIDITASGGNRYIDGPITQPFYVDSDGPYDTLTFDIYGSGIGGSNVLRVRITDNTTSGPYSLIDVTDGAWTTVSIPLSTLRGGVLTHFSWIQWRDNIGSGGYSFYLDNVRLERASAPTAFSCATNEMGGTVFYDANANGSREGISDLRRENGIADITVTAYDITNTIVISGVTDSNGRYKFNVPDGQQVRIEFTDVPTWYHSSMVGSHMQTSVVFTTSNANCGIDFGLQAPEQFCDSSPTMATTCFVSGDPLAGGNAGTADVLVSFPFTASGDSDLAYTGGDYNIPDPAHVASGVDLGSAWGLAYQRTTGDLFAAAFLKRHVGFGPLGLGGIYQIDSVTHAITQFVDISSVVGITINVGIDPRTGICADPANPTANCLQADKRQPSYDQDAFGLVGKMSFGDIDISADDRTLWVMSLADKALYEIFIDSPAQLPDANDITIHAISNPGCTNNEYVPFAVKVYRGLVYVGVTCTGETSQVQADLHAYILSLDPTAATPTFSSVYDFDLLEHGTPDEIANWLPWARNGNDVDWNAPSNDGNAEHPQPILSDIEFDTDGSMVIGIIDRFGHQSGPSNYSTDTSSSTTYGARAGGDILRVCNNNGTFVLESNGTCPSNPYKSLAGTSTGEGPGNGEYYWGDSFPMVSGHRETGSGGLALLHGSGLVASTVMDPLYWETGGVVWFNNVTGDEDRAYELYRGGLSSGLLGKATGLGDLELFCALPTIEIGNRVWYDTDGDGIQGAGESGISGIDVALTCNGNTITTTTDSQGQYLFSSNGNAAAVLAPTVGCTLTVSVTQSSLISLTLTTINADANTSNNAKTDLRDSDALLNLSQGTINFTVGSAGENNHSFDFGFKASPPSIDLIKRLNTPDPVRPGETITFTIALTNTGSYTLTTVPLTDTYNTTYLTFVTATVLPVDGTNDGQLHWTDLTTATPNGFGQDLGPNTSFSLVVTFTAQQDTTLLPGGNTENVATVYTRTVTATVQVVNPTAVDLVDQSVQWMTDHMAISWQTESEVGIVGFHLHRHDQENRATQLTQEPIPAHYAGQPIGAVYRYQDNWAMVQEVVHEQYRYILEILSAFGPSRYIELGETTARGQLFLPLISR